MRVKLFKSKSAYRQNERNAKMQKTQKVKDAKLNKKKALIIFVSAFIAVAVIFGAVMGIVSAVKEANAVFSFDGVIMDEDVASFFIGRFKTKYIHDLRASGYTNAENTEKFWNSAYDKDRTHGDIMISLAERQLKQIVVNNYLFDRYSSLTDEDEALIEKAISETLEYHTGGSMDEFQSLAATYGFDYDSYCEAVEMLYKSDRAFAAIYGQDGTAMKNDTSACAKYLSEYSHVSLIFIRTEDKLITFDDGSTAVHSLDADERAKRLDTIEKIRTAIEAKENGTDGQITPTAFAEYLSTYGEGDKNYDSMGHYFHEDSDFTKEYATQFPEVTEKALSMAVGEYAEVAVDFINRENPNAKSSPGVCFIYKSSPASGAYAESTLKRCFSDFYSDAATALYVDTSEILCRDMERGNKYSELNFIAISTNSILYPRYDEE